MNFHIFPRLCAGLLYSESLRSFVELKYGRPSNTSNMDECMRWLGTLPTPALTRIYTVLHKKGFIASPILNEEQMQVLISLHLKNTRVFDIVFEQLTKHEHLQ